MEISFKVKRTINMKVLILNEIIINQFNDIINGKGNALSKN